MYPRAAAAISALLLSTAAASPARAEETPPGNPPAPAPTAPPQAWIMPSAPPPAAPPPASAPPPAYPAPPAPTAMYPAPAPAYPAPASTGTYPSFAPSYPASAAPAQGTSRNTVAYDPPARPGSYWSGAAVSSLTPGGPARAESPVRKAPAPRDFHVDLGVGTEIPISVGGVLTAELPHRFLLQLGVGVMPRPYAEAIDGFLTSVGAYDAMISQAVRASLGNALVVRGSLGGRPFADHGFEILGGYTLIKGNGSLDTADALQAILVETGVALEAPDSLRGGIPISATLHNFHATIGWRWLLADDRLVLRASLSYIQTLASEVAVDVPDSATELAPYEGLVNSEINGFLGPFFSTYAKAPTLGLSGAFRF